MIPLWLIGGGGHCKSCIDVIESTSSFKILGIIDDKEKIGQKINAYSIVASDSDIQALLQESNQFCITIGQIHTSEIRRKIYTFYKEHGASFPVIQASTCIVSNTAMIQEGTMIMHQAFVNASAKIGRCCIINSKALIEHDCLIEDFVHISTGAIVNGDSYIRQGSFIGSGTVTRHLAYISENSFIKAGSVVKSKK